MKKEHIRNGFILLGMVFAFCFTLVNGKKVQAADSADKATVILHKVKMESAVTTEIQNTGEEMTEFSQYQALGQVNFKVYDVTAEFYSARATQTQAEATQVVQNLVFADDTKLVNQGTTKADGSLEMTVSKKSVDAAGKEQDAVYSIIETQKDGVTKSANLILSFPVYALDGNGVATENELGAVSAPIHLYPKNVVSNDGQLSVTKVGTGNQEKLDGAEFVVSKVEAGTTSYILSSDTGLYTWTTDKNGAKHFITGNDYETSDKKISEAIGETGRLTISSLEVGTYNLEEVKAPDNAERITSETNKAFTIASDTTAKNPVTVTVKNDTSKVTKTAFELEGQSVAIGQAINYQIAVNIPLGIADQKSDGSGNQYDQFALTDQHDEVLTLNDAAGINLVVSNQNVTFDLGVDYELVKSSSTAFSVNLTPTGIDKIRAFPGEELQFTYAMYLNEKATAATNGFKNEANVENGHTEHFEDTPPSVEVYTGGFIFEKVDLDANNQALAGAEFVVSRLEGSTVTYLVVDPTSHAVSWGDKKDSATVYTTSADGLVSIDGLAYGDYSLEEIKAPTDYVKLDSAITFVVSDQSFGTTQKAPQLVGNKHKGVLPHTGGSGIVAFIIIGAVLIGAGGFYFYKRQQTI